MVRPHPTLVSFTVEGVSRAALDADVERLRRLEAELGQQLAAASGPHVSPADVSLLFSEGPSVIVTPAAPAGAVSQQTETVHAGASTTHPSLHVQAYIVP